MARKRRFRVEEYSSFLAINSGCMRKTHCAELASEVAARFVSSKSGTQVIQYPLISKYVLVAICCFTFSDPGVSFIQESEPQGSQQTGEVIDKVKDKVVETADIVKDKAQEIGATIDESAAAHDVSQSILNPIYEAAEVIGQYPAFYWAAFTLMVAGAVSFLLQLVFTKFLLLFRGHLNIKEILMDVAGLAVSLTGIILTTQAAAENSAPVPPATTSLWRI